MTAEALLIWNQQVNKKETEKRRGRERNLGIWCRNFDEWKIRVEYVSNTCKMIENDQGKKDR